MAAYYQLWLFLLDFSAVWALTLLREKVTSDDTIEAKRASWEHRENITFPGRAWGEEPHCASERHSTQGDREGYLTPYLTLWGSSKGLEVGPCSMAQSVPWSYTMDYVDVEAASTQNCVGKVNAKQSQTIIDDATTLQKVENNTYDLFVISHVMEHMDQVVLGMQTWMRILKPGGIALIIVPHMCDNDVNGDHFRLLTKPEHFIEEFHNPALAEEHSGEHMRESAIMAWGFMERDEPGFATAEFFDDVSKPPTAHDISSLAEVGQQRPHANHLHTFTESSVRGLLSLVQKNFPVESQFDVLDVSPWKFILDDATTFLHDEVRVILRKK